MMLCWQVYWQVLKLNKIIIFTGPKNQFEVQVTNKIDNDYSTLSEIVEVLEAARNLVSVEIKGQKKQEEVAHFYEHLVCFSDEFNGISENLLLSFFSRTAKLNIQNVYLHNPPTKIIEQARMLNVDIIEIENVYKSLTKKNVIAINNEFEEHIIGQNEVKKELLVSLIPLLDEKKSKPVVIMLYGPTGVGKTETAKFVGEIIGGEFFRQQFSMFQNQRAYDFLFGGVHGTNSLSYELLNRESNVILLDEFDKVNSSLYSAFYEVFDEGIFKDVLYRVNLKNSLIICTSNFKNLNDIKETLGAPIFSRFDNFIEYKPLSPIDKAKIIDMRLDDLLDAKSEVDRELIDRELIYRIMLARLDRLDNVREINKDIEKLISIQLLNVILQKETE